jgi:hypothetical protein
MNPFPASGDALLGRPEMKGAPLTAGTGALVTGTTLALRGVAKSGRDSPAGASEPEEFSDATGACIRGVAKLVTRTGIPGKDMLTIETTCLSYKSLRIFLRFSEKYSETISFACRNKATHFGRYFEHPCVQAWFS